jgi:hypothetical protein
LIGVEDLRSVPPTKGRLQGIQADLRVKAVEEFPAEHPPWLQIHNRDQVKEAFREWDGGDIDCLYLIHSSIQAEIRQTGKALRWIARELGAGFLIDRP